MEYTLQSFESATHYLLTAGRRMSPDRAVETAIDLLSNATWKHAGSATRVFLADNAAKLLAASIYRHQKLPISRASIAAEAFWSYRYDQLTSEFLLLDIVDAVEVYEYEAKFDSDSVMYLQFALSKCIAARAWAIERLPKEASALVAVVDTLMPSQSEQTTKELLEQAYSATSFSAALQPLTEAYHRHFEDSLDRGFHIAKAVDIALGKGLLSPSISVEELRLWMKNAIDRAQRQKAPEMLAQALVVAYRASEVEYK